MNTKRIFIFFGLFFINSFLFSQEIEMKEEQSEIMSSCDTIQVAYNKGEYEAKDKEVFIELMCFDDLNCQAYVHSKNGELIKKVTSSGFYLEELKRGDYIVVLDVKETHAIITTTVIK